MNGREDAKNAVSPDQMSELFAQLVMQQSNMALTLMGKIAHGEDGQVVQDLDAARLFIDELEMIEHKTKGNLSREEEYLLKQTLMTLRLAFVQTVESADQAKTPGPAEKTGAPSQPAASATPGESTAAGGDEEHRKKFSKKY